MGVMELSRTELEELPESKLQSILEEMSTELTSRVAGSPDFDAEVENILRELEAKGHDLHLYDSDGGW